MGRSARNRQTEVNFWPGFVDALATLLLVMVFVISIFVVAQMYAGTALSSRDDALANLNAQVRALEEELRAGEARRNDLSQQLDTLSGRFAETQDALSESDARAAGLAATLATAEGRALALASDLESEQALSAEREAEIALLNQELASLTQDLNFAQTQSSDLSDQVTELRGRLAKSETALEESDARAQGLAASLETAEGEVLWLRDVYLYNYYLADVHIGTIDVGS
ncbi:MAG: hypothetical protein AAGL49_12030, partial [Pseudomonadota bacterium]